MPVPPPLHLYAATPSRQVATASANRRVLADELLLDATRSKLYERWFRDATAANPALVIEPCREHDLTDDDWYLWKTEFGVEESGGSSVGAIALLLISSSAVLESSKRSWRTALGVGEACSRRSLITRSPSPSFPPIGCRQSPLMHGSPPNDMA